MKNKNILNESLLKYLIKNKIATIDELKSILNTESRMTIFRRLSELEYISSCSHSGKYYSLERIARYNRYGLWFFNSVLFSKYGTLKNTLAMLISNSLKGYTSSELNKITQSKVDDALFELYKLKYVNRKKYQEFIFIFLKILIMKKSKS